jgi:predicted anti-sigma-YlaC factor YlaD
MTGFSGLYCDRARLWASLAADGEGSASELASLRAHLRVCPECEAWCDELPVLVHALRTAALVEPEKPVFLPAPLRARRLRMRSVQWAASAAAVVAAVALGHFAATLTSSPNAPAVVRVGIAATQQPYLEERQLALLRRTEAHGPRGEMIPV